MSTITKKQKNSLFEAVRIAGVDPAQYDLTEGKSWIKLAHQPSRSDFVVKWSVIRRYYLVQSVAGDNPSTREVTDEWPRVASMANAWTHDVKDFMDTPDLWAELRRENDVPSGSEYEAMSNTQFTPDERLRIAGQLRGIKNYVAEQYPLSGEQLSQVEARLDQIEEATHHIGRKDWLLMFYGVMFTLIVTALVPPDAVQHIIATVIHGLGDIFGFGGPPLGLPPVA